MATTLTTSYKLVGSVSSGTYSVLRLYGKYNSQSTSSNTSSVTFQLRLYGNGGSGSFSSGTAKINGSSTTLGSTSFTNGSETTLATKTFTFTHISDGTLTKSISYSVTSTYAAAASGSGTASVTLPQILRTSALSSISNFTIGDNITINFTKYVSSYTQKLEVIYGSTTVKTISSISSGSTISFTDDELETIYSLMPSTEYGTFTFKLTTLNGSTTIGTSSKTAIGTISSSIVPTIDSVELTEFVVGIASQFDAYVQNKSNIIFSITATSPGSSVSTSTTILNETTQYSGLTFNTGTITRSGTNSYSITVKDGRERTATYEGTFDVLAYNLPAINNFECYRCDADGNVDDDSEYLYCNIDAEITSLNELNYKTFKLKYKKKTDTSYTTLLTYGDDYYCSMNDIFSGFSADSGYDIVFEMTDYFGTSSVSTEVYSSFSLLDFISDGTGVSVGKVNELSNTFEVGLETVLYNNTYISEDINSDKYPILAYRVSGNTEPLSYVIVNYVDEDGNTLADSVTLSDYVGENYTTTATEIAGYEVSDIDGTTKGTYTEDTITVTYIYSRLTSSVVVNYVDENGNTLADSITLTGYVGDSYTIDDLSEVTYGLVDDEEILTGTYTEESQEITLTYHIYSYILEYVTTDGETATLGFDDLSRWSEKLTTLNVDSLGSYLYYSMGTYESIKISSVNGTSSDNLYQLLAEQYNLISIDLSELDTSSTTDMEMLFNDCSAISTLDLSTFNTSNVTNMSYMFGNCYNLEKIDLSSFDTSNVTDMSGMFYECNSLITLDLSSFDFTNVTNTDDMFTNCYALQTIYVKDETAQEWVEAHCSYGEVVIKESE